MHHSVAELALEEVRCTEMLCYQTNWTGLWQRNVNSQLRQQQHAEPQEVAAGSIMTANPASRVAYAAFL